MIPGLSQRDFDLVWSVFAKFESISEVWLFGSRAMGNYKTGSDIDLALKGSISLSTLARINAVLNEELPVPYIFDLVVYDSIESVALREHIDRLGKVVYQRNKT